MPPQSPDRMLVYNLFPTLAGSFSSWGPHIMRAADMGFNWIFVNPVQKPGISGSLYSIKDYYSLNPLLLDPASSLSPDDQLREAVRSAGESGVSMMIDLVINHSAIDSHLVGDYPQWYAHDKAGKVAHPFAMDGKRKVIWGDLARFDHEHTTDPEGLYQYFKALVEHLIRLGFRGFRCDAAYQVPRRIWRRLITEIRASHPDVVFTAETLGCPPEQTLETASAGFDYIFNSSKWWDFKGDWLMEQYDEFREVCPSISFPESHDTQRLAEEFDGNIAALMRAYLFSAIFSGGVMIPMGFEFGFRKRLHVVDTRPADWEETDIDLTSFIREINHIKASHDIFLTDAPTSTMAYKGNPKILLIRKNTSEKAALVVLNLDHKRMHAFSTPDINQLTGIKGNITLHAPGKKTTKASGRLEMSFGPGEGAIFTNKEEYD